MLVSTGGVPLPPSDVIARLRLIDPKLGLKFQPGLDDESWWAITFVWPENDRRWGQVVNGSVPREDAVDILTFLPRDCSVDDACAYLENHLVRYGKDDGRRLVARLRQARARDQQEAGDRLIDKTLEKYNPRKLFANELGELPAPMFVPAQIS